MNRITTWYEMHNQHLCLIAQNMGYSKEDSRDFVQQFFLDILQKEQLAAVQNPRAFLTLAFKRKLIDFYRSSKRNEKKKETAVSVDQEPSIENTYIEVEEQREILNRIGIAYRKIPDRCRNLIYLKYYKGLTTEEIMIETGLSSQTVYNNLCKGIQLLRKELNNNNADKNSIAYPLIYLLLYLGSENLS